MKDKLPTITSSIISSNTDIEANTANAALELFKKTEDSTIYVSSKGGFEIACPYCNSSIISFKDCEQTANAFKIYKRNCSICNGKVGLIMIPSLEPMCSLICNEDCICYDLCEWSVKKSNKG